MLLRLVLLGMLCCASAGAASPVAHAPVLRAGEGAADAAKPATTSVVGTAEGTAKEALRLRGGAEPVQLEAKIELSCENLLGEAPMWHEVEQKLYWLDINGKKLWSYSPSTSETRSWDLPEVAGSFAFRESGGFLMGFASGLAWYDPETGAQDKVCAYEEGLNTRPNDGKCDREGNFVIGSYNNNHRNDQKNIAGLWRLSKGDLSLTEILDYRFRCSNTIAFDAKGTTMYFCDTPTKKIYKFDYAPDAPLSNRQLFAEMAPEETGGPDGATVDSEGGVWVAQAGNWRVVRHRASDGAVDYEVKLPLNNPTSCSIGGEGMDTLFITTARHRLSDQERKEQPGAGQLWSLKLPGGIKGLAEPRLAA
uniref:SMP-30/Gluconolactonase/LRE-like region domain-containing protein n=1 Tax=Hemiselmis tepida TaxID=464990 RepID=A0A7S0VDI7_9CRYP|mmetsp:Transcript_16649/g.42162  ORF Transcript_16649/g.42162 Transcript_16649/m.42162 type:complete len:364 (+) Transcript_16649:3-1094(+)